MDRASARMVGVVVMMALRKRRWALACVALFVVAAIAVLAGCGGSAASTAGPADGAHAPAGASNGQTSYGPAATAAPGQTPGASPQRLIKALDVAMQFADTNKVASDLQAWIVSADPQSTSAGSQYQQVGDNLYHISLTFSVAASAYPRIYAYLAGYASTHDGKLIHLQESVQDVTNDFIDTQSRLTNLRTEQSRLLDLMKSSTNLNDTLTVEQHLTDVEGQIEQIEEHLNALNGQTTFYKVTIQLDPTGTAVASAPNAPWNPGETIHNAFNAALGFGEVLLNILIWLAFFAVYFVPAVLLFLLIRRIWRARQAHRGVPAPAMASAPRMPPMPPMPPRPTMPPNQPPASTP
jgi:Domain of unknown function (DUF4349)